VNLRLVQKDEEPEMFAYCPNCNAESWQFLPRFVVRRRWFGLRKRIYAVICRACKRVVGWEA
jgi:hypothetical protein